MGRAKYRNDVYLTGIIGQGFEYKKTQEGAEFATFLLEMNNGYMRKEDSTVHDKLMYLRVMVFDSRLVEYLKNNGAKNNDAVSIFARLNSKKYEKKGIVLYQINIIANDIILIRNRRKNGKLQD